MVDIRGVSDANPGGMERIRLSEWARQQGISRITAYRMLRRRMLPVPSERSPTGRWYVLVPPKRIGRAAIYTRATPGPHQIEEINQQIAALSEWATIRYRSIFTIVREIANPYTSSMPRLQRLLADRQISNILIHNPAIVGLHNYDLLTASLAPAGRAITSLQPGKPKIAARRADLKAAITGLCIELNGLKKGPEIAHQLLDDHDDEDHEEE